MKSCFENSPKPYFSIQMRYDLEIIYPNTPPLPGQTIVGYMIYERPKTLFVSPCSRPFGCFGYLSVVALAILFWPLSCLPFCLGCSYDGFQVPVYE
jgi:hypothetical protein